MKSINVALINLLLDMGHELMRVITPMELQKMTLFNYLKIMSIKLLYQLISLVQRKYRRINGMGLMMEEKEFALILLTK